MSQMAYLFIGIDVLHILQMCVNIDKKMNKCCFYKLF